MSLVKNGKTLAGIYGGITSKDVTQAEYDALPSSKLTDGIYYNITDSDTSIKDLIPDGASATNKLVAQSDLKNINATSLKVDNGSTYNSQVIPWSDGTHIRNYKDDDNYSDITFNTAVQFSTKVKGIATTFNLLTNNDVGKIQMFYFPSISASGSVANHWCSSTFTEGGKYILLATVLWLNPNVNQDLRIICSAASVAALPFNRVYNPGYDHTYNLFGYVEVSAGAQIGIYGDFTCNGDTNFWNIMAIKVG